MITKKHIITFATACLLLTIGGCSSDEPFRWNNREIPEDETIIAFTSGEFSAISLDTRTLTRAGSEAKMVADARSVIGDYLYLYQFNSSENGEGTLIEAPLKLKKSDFSLTNKIYSISLKRAKLHNGAIGYMVANPGTIIPAVPGTTTENVFKTTVLNFSDLQGGSSADIPFISDPMKIDFDATNGIGVYDLRRPYTRVKVTYNPSAGEDINFLLTGAALYQVPAAASYWSKGEEKADSWQTLGTDYEMSVTPYSASGTTANNGIAATLSTYREGDDFELNFVKRGDWLAADYLPIKYKDNDPLLIVKGYFAQSENEDGTLSFKPVSGNAQEVYYAAKIGRNLSPNKSYNITVKGVASNGAVNADEAAKNPSSATVQITEETETITSIISDGVNVLGVEEKATVDADGNGTMTILLRNSKEKLTGTNFANYIKLDCEEAWLNKDQITPTIEDVDTNAADEGASSLYQQKVTFTFNAESNLIEREASLKITLYPDGNATAAGNDDDKRKLSREITVTQLAAEGASLSNILDIRLTTSAGGINNIDYLSYIGQTDPENPGCAGLQPDENGNRDRNHGLHWPMPNGDVTYTYTIILKEGYTLQGGKSPVWGKVASHVSGSESSGWTVTLSSNATDAQGYSNWSELESIKFPITANGVDTEIDLDLYHTGFFHDNLYYEVVTVNGKQWLDRNIGATSAGMYEKGTALGTDIWPARGEEAAGGLYDNSTVAASLPNGWRVPSVTDLMGLTNSSSFSNNQETIGNGTCFASRMVYKYTENGREKTASSYFPHNQIMDGSKFEGQQGSAFYLTRTPAGAANWYEMVVMNGAAVYTRNMEIDNRRAASVRAIKSESSGTSSGDKYECSAKGYTHVYLYAENSDGSRSFVNSWPGEVIATLDMADKRFHPFTLTSYVPYKTYQSNPVGATSTLKVIFNKVDANGTIIASSAGAGVTANSEGMIFHNKWGYCGNPSCEDQGWHQNGHSCTGLRIYIKGNSFQLTGNDWGDPGKYIELTKNGSKYTKTGVVVTTTNDRQFCIGYDEGNGIKENWCGESDKNVILGSAMKIGGVRGDNFRLSSAGTYDFTVDTSVSPWTVTVTNSGGSQGGDDTVTIYCYNTAGWENMYLWIDGSWPGITMTKASGNTGIPYYKATIPKNAALIIINNNEGDRIAKSEVQISSSTGFIDGTYYNNTDTSTGKITEPSIGSGKKRLLAWVPDDLKDNPFVYLFGGTDPQGWDDSGLSNQKMTKIKGRVWYYDASDNHNKAIVRVSGAQSVDLDLINNQIVFATKQ